jgi:hypothetical protein
MASRARICRIACLAVLVGLASAGVAAADPPTIVSFNPGAFGTITVQPGTNPASTGLTLTVDLRPIGGAIRAPYVDQGLVCDDDTRDYVFYPCFTRPLYTPPGTYTLAYTVSDAEGRSSSRTQEATIGPPTDTDADGLPDSWETAFGFNPAVAGDGAADTDGDGATNAAELVAGTHPTATFTRYFAEGADSSFFSTRVDLFNPSASTALALVRMQASDGAQSSVLRTIAPFSSALVAGNVPGNDYSIVIEADRLVVAERTVQWLPATALTLGNARTYGSHAESAIAGPGTAWYLAEGATHGGFDLFYLLQNPGNAAATVTIDYLRPAPLPPLVKTYAVGPHARRTIYVDAEGPELVATDVSATITSTVPIVAERAMYFGTPEQPFAAGHDGAASPVLSTDWYLAEGAGNFFDTFILLANPGATDATVTLTFLGEGGGTPITRSHTVAARSRLTVNPNGPVNGIGIGVFSTVVSSTAPIVVERAMWWPSGSTWREAHLVHGATALATRWALAPMEVRTGSYSSPTTGDAESFVMIANPSTTATTVTVSDGTRSTTFPLAGQSRLTLPVSFVESLLRGRPGAASGSFPLIVQSAGPPIVVERASYRDSQGVFWADGSALLATPIP